jgi:glyoxylase-like metal-dependent hydrolase (beta-lactamase superfamily II)
MMNRSLSMGACVGMILMAAVASAETVAGLPVHIQRLSPEVVRVWVGDAISSTATVAVATTKGVLVVDTTGNTVIDGELRGIIARELGRSDFKVLINTHEHGDHTGGNGAYADCDIVGHELVGAGMAAAQADKAQSLAWYATRIPELERELAAQPAGSAAMATLQEQLTVTRLNHEALASKNKPVPPTKTFSDRLTLDMGDTAVELYYIGGMHSASDIAVFLPKHGLLLTGDTMSDKWLTDTPGCLASFVARAGVRHDFPLLLENWDLLLAKKDAVKVLVPGHWNGELSRDGFAARVEYVRTLWNGVNRCATEGGDLAALQAELALPARFPALVASPGFSRENNYMTILALWTNVTGQESAADRLYALVDEGQGDEAIGAVVTERGAKPARYFFLEGQINYAGYRFLQEGKVPQAVRIMTVNRDLFPESWNVHDSLGEALLAAGDAGAATASYEKSLALNPGNASATEALARIRNGAAAPGTNVR